MDSKNINSQFQDLKMYVDDLGNVLHESKNVDADSRKKLLRYKIDVTNSWIDNETYIQRVSPTMVEFFNNNSANNIDPVLFKIYNGNANLTHFISGNIKYEDLGSKTSLLFENNKGIQKVSLQEGDGKSIVLDDEQVKQFLDALQVSENLGSMKSIVKTESDKLNKLNELNVADENVADKLSVNAVLARIKAGRKYDTVPEAKKYSL